MRTKPPLANMSVHVKIIIWFAGVGGQVGLLQVVEAEDRASSVVKKVTGLLNVLASGIQILSSSCAHLCLLAVSFCVLS